ncbi:protein dehydratase [Citrobacter amalonaticus]|uniref:Protein dehydratase n=1 Tax=Citrobacter amalonaticus TaxID=35703 RepID=A0A2S4RY46_CITAM|nr:type II secretion system F family protein [Citrobacter amalonaticus]POT57841.1 protein dehydratase [Citrobacter amalonaticus]POT76632.1 protein dehydratase [Citrobacter amalonaticus]POU65711.1 protein dehydratase [Citrobacter amalonaticus]POV05868.1 protein dehydratase [Citrobacter amalonaticus]
MTLFFILLVILGVVNFIAVLIYYKKVKKLDGGEQRFRVATKKKNWSGQVLEKIKEAVTGDVRSIKSTYRNMKPKEVALFFGLFLAGVYLNIAFLKFNIIIASVVLLIVLSYLHFRISKKKQRALFEIEFSEALNIINSSISSGNSIVVGITHCGNKLNGEVVGPELKIVSRRLSIGEDVYAVLMDSYERLPYREYYFFILAVIININGGGQVREVMTRLAKQISDAKIIDRKKLTMTSEARMSVKVLAMIPVGFVFVLNILSPENFDILINHDSGRMILYYAIGSVCLGLAIIWNMMNKAV